MLRVGSQGKSYDRGKEDTEMFIEVCIGTGADDREDRFQSQTRRKPFVFAILSATFSTEAGPS